MAKDDDIVSYNMKAFVERGLKDHRNVSIFAELDHRRYSIRRKIGDEIEMYISGKYLFAEADYYDVKTKHPSVDCIVLGSPYASYTATAGQAAMRDQRGLLTYREFYGALNFRNYRTYGQPKTKKTNKK